MIRLGICNELFEGWDFARTCETVRSVGFEGLEIAPFTLAPRIEEVSPARRAELRRIMADTGLECIGLHWLLAKTEGFYLTSPDRAVRDRTARYLVALAEACRDLDGSVLVLGSPKQRSLLPGVDQATAEAYAVEMFQQIMPEIASAGVELCFEPLSAAETDFINTVPQTMDLAAKVGHPAFRLHMDVKAQSADPTGSVPELIRRYGPVAGHFHAQDPNLRGPGMGPLDFGPILEALVASGYDRWVSVEVFDFTPGAERTAQESYTCLRRELDRALAGGVGA
jgi:sugar phosphate isomerase/epimerase